MNELPDQLPNLSSLSHEQKDEIIRMLFPLIAEVRRLSARLSKQPQFEQAAVQRWVGKEEPPVPSGKDRYGVGHDF
jgi:hypothetical protein